MPTDRAGWIRWVGYAVAATLVVAAILYLVRALDLFGAPPQRGDGQDFVEFLLQVASFDQPRVLLYDAPAVLFAAAFAGFGILGLLLPLRTGPGGRALTALFVLAGALGVASEMVEIAVTAVAADPTYCDCGYLAEEIVGRLQAVNVGFHMATWIGIGALTLTAAGLAVWGLRVVAGGRAAPRWLALAGAALLAVYVVLQALDLGTPGDVVLLVAVGLVLPAWALTLPRAVNGAMLPDPA